MSCAVFSPIAGFFTFDERSTSDEASDVWRKRLERRTIHTLFAGYQQDHTPVQSIAKERGSHSAHRDKFLSCLIRPRSLCLFPKFPLANLLYHRFGASLYIGPPRLALDRGKSKRYLPGPRRSSLVPLPLCSVAMPGVDRENNDLRGPLPSLVPLLTQFSDSPAPSVYRGGKPVGQ